MEKEILEVQNLMSAFSNQWFVVGGWALDLFIGTKTRHHQDIEIGIYRSNQESFRHYLKNWNFRKVVNSQTEIWCAGEWLDPPIHELHGEHDGTSLEILLQDEDEAGNWLFRRNEIIRRDKRDVVLTSGSGVPFLCPEIVLLYKAKDPQNKDERDFTRLASELGTARKDWLRQAIAQCYPDHCWISRLQ